MKIKSVYNFVPAPKENEVFKPDWADQVSHDIPFSDGESGEIDIKITAETPIFIRNGHAEGDETNEFSHYEIDGEKKYFIPATSLKGMFRNVLEIITASKLNPKLVNDDRYSFRDLTRNSLYMKKYNSNKVKAGWLEEDGSGHWVIHECDEFHHMHHREVDKALETTFRDDFLNKNPKEKTARFKYEQVEKSLEINYSTEKDKKGKTKALFLTGEPIGTIVMTGQSSKRNENKKHPIGKVHEFVFSNSTNGTLDVSTKQKDDFKFIYLDHDSQNISEDWKYWKSKLRNGKRMPVFFMKNSDNELLHFGLAYMYKLPYRNSVHEMVPINQYKNNNDLAEIIFGTIDKGDSLKGRVMFGHAFSENAQPFKEVQKEILGGPKASYFPFYLRQENVSKGYSTYWDKGELSGFKRYPVRSDVLNKKYSEKQKKNSKVFSYFLPLEEGAEFYFKIRFHNLRKVEIGALLSAISFHHHQSSCYHSLGGAKPLGYGKISITELKLRNSKFNQEEYLAELENLLGNQNLKDRLTELISMASNKNDSSLDYPTLDMDKRINDFEDYKKNKKYLADFSSKNNVEVNLIAERIKREKAAKEQAKKEEEKRIAQEKENQLAESLKSSNNVEELSQFIIDYPLNENAQTFRERIQHLNREKNKREAEKLSENYLPNFKDGKFKTTQEECKTPFNKNKYFNFSDEAKTLIENQIRRVWKEDNKTFYSKKKLTDFGRFPWSDIIKWLGKERAKKLYDELTR